MKAILPILLFISSVAVAQTPIKLKQLEPTSGSGKMIISAPSGKPIWGVDNTLRATDTAVLIPTIYDSIQVVIPLANSITTRNNFIQLVGDTDYPAPGMVYGTDSLGNKKWVIAATGGSITNLSFTQAASTVTVTPSAGTSVVLPSATQSLAGVMSAADKGKVDATGRVFNVKIYGAKADGQTFTDATMASSSTTLTTSGSHFTSADAGKSIIVKGAGASSHDLITTIVVVNGVSSITLANSAIVSVSAVEFTYGTDDVAAIQAATNASVTAGGGQVAFPDGVYILASALQTSIAGVNPNSEIYIPAPTDSRDPSRTEIEFVGETAPNMIPGDAYNGVAYTNTRKGVVLYSLVVGSGVAPSVFGTMGPSTAFQNFNYTGASFRNLTIMVAANPTGSGPTMGGINGRHFYNMGVENFLYTIDASVYNNPLPANDVAGLIMPEINCELNPHAKNVQIIGARYGFVAGEHTSVDQLSVASCWAGYVQTFNYHASYVGRYCSVWNKYSIYIPAGSILGFSTIGATNFHITELDAEVLHTTGKWYDQTIIVHDSLNYGYGTIAYHLVEAFVGVNNALWTNTGASHVKSYAILNGPSAGGGGGGDAYLGNSQVFTGNNQFNGTITTTGNNFFTAGTSTFSKASGAARVGISAGDATAYAGIDFNTSSGLAGQFVGTGPSYTSAQIFHASSLNLAGYYSGGIGFYTPGSIRFGIGTAFTDADNKLTLNTNGTLDYASDVSGSYNDRSVIDLGYFNAHNTGGGGGGYTLPIATASSLGGIKVGTGLAINATTGVLSATGGGGGGDVYLANANVFTNNNQFDGALSVNGAAAFTNTATFSRASVASRVAITTPTASAYSGIDFNTDGGLSGQFIAPGSTYAGAAVFHPNSLNLTNYFSGGMGFYAGTSGSTIRFGIGTTFTDADNKLTIKANGTVDYASDVSSNYTSRSLIDLGYFNSHTYTLPTASATVLGGVKVGTGLSIDGSSVLSVTGTASAGESVLDETSQNYTVSTANGLMQNILYDFSGGGGTFTLPTGSGADKLTLYISNTTTGTLTFSQSIFSNSSTSTTTMAAGAAYKLIYNNTASKWYVIVL
jgi:hypothetical protein